MSDKHSGVTIGTTALFPRRLLINGKACNAAVSGDFAVDKSHRAFWPALILQRAAISSCARGNFEFLYGFPNTLAQPLQLRAGYKVVDHFVAGVQLLRSEPAMEAHHVARFLPGVSRLIDALLPLVSAGRNYQPSGDYTFESLQCFDDRFDRFWKRVLPRFSVISDRTAEYLNWRFATAPHKRYSIFAAIETRTGDIAGYVVSWAKAGKVRISDLLVSEEAVLDSLIPEFTREQRKQDAYCITLIYLGHPKLIRKLRKLGFFFRQATGKALVYAPPSSPHAQMLLNPNNWYLLDGDSDC